MMICLLNLPSETLLHILSFLSGRDLSRCFQVCRRLRDLGSSDLLWKRHCEHYWLLDRCADKRWRQLFVDWCHDWGRYISVYRKIRKAWNQIETFTSEYCPSLYSSLNDGMSEEGVTGIASRFAVEGNPLPLDLMCSYRIHDGQQDAAGLMGERSLGPDIIISEILMPLQHIHYHAMLPRTCQVTSHETTPGSFLMLTKCVNGPDDELRTSEGQYMSLTDQYGYQLGQIFYAVHQYSMAVPQSQVCFHDNFITGTSFSDWLCSYAQLLEDQVFSVINKKLFRFYNEPGCAAHTGDITVKVGTCLLPEGSHIRPEPSFVYIYRITMSMAADANPNDSCKLETRHWTIMDEDGNEETVEGPGVVGEYPVMEPGAVFSWESFTNFKTTYGNMKGYFAMRRLRDGVIIHVQCPVFHMKCLPYQTEEERDERALLIKKDN